ncbi:MAG: ArnT family glycosyltransferase [Phototrophicaceae bacterium]|jgi:4-amino-4-deoxy-L-arabinose transferase-like glycosyltransferase
MNTTKRAWHTMPLHRVSQGGWWAWALLTALILVAALPVLAYPLGRDQGEFATIGAVILRGGVPYIDVWNPKPPAVFYVYAGAMALFGQTVWALRALDLLLFAALSGVMYAIGRQLHNRAVGLIAGGLLGVFYFTETFWTLTQNDGIAMLPMALAVWCALAWLEPLPLPPPLKRRGENQVPLPQGEGFREGLAWAFASGAACALTLWFKYPFITVVIALVIGVIWGAGRFPVRAALAFVCGGLLIGLGGMALLAWAGAFNAWIESIAVTTGYAAQGIAEFWPELRRYSLERLRRWHILWGLLALAPLLWGRMTTNDDAANDKNPTQSHNLAMTKTAKWRMIFLWLLGALLAMLIQAKAYDYHWLPILPPLCLIAAGVSVGLWDALPAILPRSLGFKLKMWFVGLLVGGGVLYLSLFTWGKVLPYWLGQISEEGYTSQFVGGEFVAWESVAVADYLRARVVRGDTLYVWGFRPELYYLTGLRPATRFIFQFPLVASWYPQQWQQENVNLLWASLPPYALVVQGDFMPWVTGLDADSNMLLQEYTELNNWLIYNYTRDTQIGNIGLWRRKSP